MISLSKEGNGRLQLFLCHGKADVWSCLRLDVILERNRWMSILEPDEHGVLGATMVPPRRGISDTEFRKRFSGGSRNLFHFCDIAITNATAKGHAAQMLPFILFTCVCWGRTFGAYYLSKTTTSYNVTIGRG